MMFIPLGVVLLMLAAFGQLIYHLAKSFAAIRHTPPQERGFEPIMVPPTPASAIYHQPQQQHGGEAHERSDPRGSDIV